MKNNLDKRKDMKHISINLSNNETGVYSESDTLILETTLSNRFYKDSIGVLKLVSRHTHIVIGTVMFSDDYMTLIDCIGHQRHVLSWEDEHGESDTPIQEVFEEQIMDFAYSLLNEFIFSHQNAAFRELLDKSKIVMHNNKLMLEEV